jgi:hypothetical protein
MSQKVVISRIQHRRGRKENLPQPLLPGELALAVDEGEIWIGGDPNQAPWGVRVYDLSSISIAEPIVDNHIADVEFDGTFTQADFNGLVSYLTTSPTPSIVLVPEDILWDGLQHVFILADETVSGLNTIANILLAIQDVSNPIAGKYVSGNALGARAPLLDPLEDFSHPNNPAFDLTDGVFYLGNAAPESNGNQAANAARLINRYNGAGIVTTISNIRVPTSGATVGQLVFRYVGVEDADPWNNWSANGTFSAINTNDKMTFISGAGIDIDIDTDNRALRITNTSVAASLNLFSEVDVSDDDTGYTWDADGTVVASGNADTLTFVSGGGVDIDVDPASNAIRITSLAGGGAFGTLSDGVNDAVAVGNDTFLFRTANDRLSLEVTNDDMTFGDNILFTLEESNIDHNALANYVANEHLDWSVDITGLEVDENNLPLVGIANFVYAYDPDRAIDHSTVEINGTDSITGGGDITATRTLSLVGDILAPGNDYYYGTDGAGDKGWYPLPASLSNTVNLTGDQSITGLKTFSQPAGPAIILSGTQTGELGFTTPVVDEYAAMYFATTNNAGNGGFVWFTDDEGVLWEFDNTGTLLVGTVPWARLTDVPAMPPDQNLFETITIDEDAPASLSFIDEFNYTGTPPAPWINVTDGLEAYNGVLYPDVTISAEPAYAAEFSLSAYDIENTRVIARFNGISEHTGAGFKSIALEIFGDNSADVGIGIYMERDENDDYTYNAYYYDIPNTIYEESSPTAYLGPDDDIEFEIEIIGLDLTIYLNGAIVLNDDISALGPGFVDAFAHIAWNPPEVGTTVGATYFEASETTVGGYTWDAVGSIVALNTTDELTFVSGDNISLDVDIPNKAVRITATVPPPSAGIESFTDLDDTPAAYTGEAGSILFVNGTADGVDYAPLYVDVAGAEYIAGTLVYPTQVVLESSLTVGAVGIEQNGIRIDGTNTPVRIKSSSFGQTASILCHQHSTTNHPQLILARSNSNGASHTAVVNGMSVGELVGVGWAATTPGYLPVAHIDFEVDTVGTVSSTSMPGRLVFRTTPDGDVVPVDALVIDSEQALIVGTPTGGGQGPGTINAEGVFVNGAEILPQVLVNDSVHAGFVPIETEFLLLPTVETIAAQDETDFDGAGDNGTFVGGDGDDGTPYAPSDTITLSDGTVITVDAVDGDGDVTEFTVTSSSTSVFTSGETLTQASTSGSGVAFSITTGPNNEAPSDVSSLDISGFAFDIDDDSDVIFVEYSLNSGGDTPGSNNFTAIGTMKIVANVNAEGGLATLVDDQTDVRDTAYTGDVEFAAELVAGIPNLAQVQYTNTLTSDVTMRIVIRRWMSY